MYTLWRSKRVNTNKRKNKNSFKKSTNISEHITENIYNNTCKWLKWHSNSCRIDCFITFYLFGIRPYLITKGIINYIKDKDLLLELEKTVSILINDPDNIILDKYWKYIDS